MVSLSSPIGASRGALKLSLLFVLANCGGKSGTGGSAQLSVAPFCSPQSGITDAVTITGTANYQYRLDGNGAITGPKPIRYAEVVVRDAADRIVQCGATTNTGNFSLQVPRGTASLRLSVQSRANNNLVKAYVLANPNTNQDHRISRNFTPDDDQSLGTLTAPANGSLQGGAFNILDKIVDANDFLRAQTTACDSIHPSCTPFTVAPLSYIYWAPGQDPGQYFNGISGVSFYVPGTSNLYLLGGLNGDVDNSDTDHFDDTIILHEYAHFLEDTLTASDSPGGPHTGNTILDARLAWGEAWANYFQAKVTGIYRYRDTFGTIEGRNGVFFNENLESGSNDQTSTLGEANFREFSITRLLVDLTDTNDENGIDDLNGNFDEIWTLLTSSSVGFRRNDARFRDVGLLHSLQGVLSNRRNWSLIQAAESHQPDRTHYANTLSAGTCSAVAIRAADNPGNAPEDGSPQNSNQFASNDFYQYTHGGGSLSLRLTYTTTSSNPADLNLYLYREDYRFGALSDIVGFSENSISTGTGSGTETVTLNSLPAGTYMINVNVFTSGGRLGSTANYRLLINNANMCPD